MSNGSPHRFGRRRIYFLCGHSPQNQKGGVLLSATGYIQIRAFTGDAQIPLKNVAIAITAPDRTLIAMRVTDRSGLTEPVAIPVPDLSDSQTPDVNPQPFTDINLYAWLELYEGITAENVQVFAGITTVQDLQMIPLSELPEVWNQSEVFNTPAQNL